MPIYLQPMKKLAIAALLLLLMVVFVHQADAQCAMCQATAESTRDAGSSAADGINKGVLYLFLTPYLIIGTIGYFWWRARKKAQA